MLGWSATWDPALRQAVAGSINRRYPGYWAAMSEPEAEARHLIDGRQVRVVPITCADEFMADMADRVERVRNVAVHRERFEPTQVAINILNVRDLPLGWVRQPLLHLRLACRWPTRSANPYFRAEDRERLLDCLGSSDVRTNVRRLERSALAADAMNAQKASPPQMRSSSWAESPGVRQSATLMSYRIGGDGLSGASILLNVIGPPPPGGFELSLVMEVGLSLQRKLSLTELAGALHAMTTTALSQLPPHLPGTRRPGERTLVETYIGASNAVAHPTISTSLMQRSNRLHDRVELSPFGTRTDRDQAMLSSSMKAESDLGPSEIRELVAATLQDMAYRGGWTDPRPGMQVVRAALGG